MHANKPKMANRWEQEKAYGGLIKKAITNGFSKQGSLQDFAEMRSGGLIGNGSLTPGNVVEFKKKHKDKCGDN
jgi:hypothetical protein